MTRKNRFRTAAGALALLFAYSGSALAQVEVTIGGIQALSGPAASYGQTFTNVIPLVNEALKADGVKLNVLAEDGAGDVPTSIAAYNKLVRVNKVPVIVHSISPVVLTLGPMGERDKVVLINAHAGAPQIAALGPYTFSTMPSYSIEGSDAAKFAYKRGSRKIVGIYQDTAAGKAAWDVFKPAFEALGGKVVGEQAYKAGATDYQPQLTQAMSAGPDWIYLSSYAGETGRILAQARRMGLGGKVQFLGIVGAAQPETIELGGAGADGFIHANWPFDIESGTPEMKKFGADYKARYGQEATVYAAAGYDALLAVGKAVKAGARTGEEIQQYLSSKLGEITGVTGTWRFDKDGMVVLPTRFILVKDGKRVPAE